MRAIFATVATVGAIAACLFVPMPSDPPLIGRIMLSALSLVIIPSMFASPNRSVNNLDHTN